MRFFLFVFSVFLGGAILLRTGYNEDAVTILVLLAVCVLAEIHKPEERTIEAGRWVMANLKWICFPLFTLSMLQR